MLFFVGFCVVGGVVCSFLIRLGANEVISAPKFRVDFANVYSLIMWAGKSFLRDLGEKDGEKRAYKK